jgi:predicted nucleic acid-binding protein
VKTFFDTNVLVYLFDSGSTTKQGKARALLAETTVRSETLLSTQVLQEFYVAVTRKLATPLDEQAALEAVEALAALPVNVVSIDTVLAAARRSRDSRLSFWDALIIQSAIEGGASTLLSEDLQDGFQTEGLTIRNPFRRPPGADER